jgi:hypothetical protein
LKQEAKGGESSLAYDSFLAVWIIITKNSKRSVAKQLQEIDEQITR